MLELKLNLTLGNPIVNVGGPQPDPGATLLSWDDDANADALLQWEDASGALQFLEWDV